ncbi:hypothetical protein FISHEDRAFT_56681 [Fistulina hepatica ATCC 64428]|uniref:Uncharacterized protein n=1 Tax=Fistulina hepatica ATCC 64428 TaxID=1128425 RepID=A0A0D7AI42_9AGAR|nr:hypothetical protein FISHEDRAFT_56681 [Fistulina hepatica ATCC 64428]
MTLNLLMFTRVWLYVTFFPDDDDNDSWTTPPARILPGYWIWFIHALFLTEKLTVFAKERPNSAIYIGHSSQGSFQIPKITGLPELLSESPLPSPTSSGLPSPPATSSTGSGSTGDPGSIALRSSSSSKKLDELNDNNNLFEGSVKVFHAAFSKAAKKPYHDNDDSHDYDFRNNDEEDNTARFSMDRTSSENQDALQRVKSLTLRNRMALDKLSSISRVSSPAPRSQQSFPSNSQSGSSSSSSSQHSRSRHSFPPPDNYLRSGSETERDSLHGDDSQLGLPSSITPRGQSPLLGRSATSTPPPTRSRLSSAPSSPRVSLRTVVTNSPRKRVSTILADDPIASSALAAVANARRSPTLTLSGKKRRPLPPEFFERPDDKRDDFSPDGSMTKSPRSTPSAFPPSPSKRATTISRLQRSFTAYDTNRRHQTRWQSEDMGSSVSNYGSTGNHGTPFRNGDYSDGEHGRPQTTRGGSSENPFRLVGESLRVAGLSRDSPSGLTREPTVRRSSARDGTPPPLSARSSRDVFEDGPRSRSRLDDFGHGLTPGVAEWDRSRSRLDDYSRDEHQRPSTSIGSIRARTSMDEYVRSRLRNDDDRVDDSPSLRSHRSSMPLAPRDRDRDRDVDRDRERDRTLARNRERSLTRRLSDSQRERSQPRYSTLGRQYPSTPGGSSTQTRQQQEAIELCKLMWESYHSFESQLSRSASRMPAARITGASDVLHGAEGLVDAAERLSGLLQQGSAYNLEAQIAMETNGGGSPELAELWRLVGVNYRDNTRVSIEIIRTLTSLLLGVGRTVHDVAVAPSRASSHGSTESSETAHGRSDSLEEPSPKAKELDREETLRRLTSLRPVTSMLTERERERERERYNTPLRSPKAGSDGPRSRLDDQSERRPERNRLVATDSQRTLHAFDNDHEPSPTPASRVHKQLSTDSGFGKRLSSNGSDSPHNSDGVLRSKTLPRPLSSLPSENYRRSQTAIAERETLSSGGESSSSRPRVRRTSDKSKPSPRGSSVSTVRGHGHATSFPGSLTSPNATTAVTTHTVSNKPDSVRFPVRRSESHSSPTESVAFSRPNTISVSALSGIQQQLADSGRRAGALSGGGDDTTERDGRRRPSNNARSVRLSLNRSAAGEAHPADRSAAATTLTPASSGRRPRRQTVTDIWS